MKIKKVEILGFKSFMEKATMEFEAGITAVVGPNGCGKSNIVDAIRWAMGEQSAKHLRGRLMEDIIFNGSEVYKPLGMAEVTLTFSNENGTAPAEYSEFSEIEVSRRIFRSGESQYLINKVPCRRKDILELFMDTGVGTKAYSIIEQDHVGQVVSAKPEERRIIIEEAAGISKYKSRKDAAERKIEATKQNLIRLGDVIREVERQMHTLESQARAAERYKKLKEKAKEIQIKLALRRYWDLMAQKDKLDILLQELEVEAERLSVRLDKEEAKLEALELQSLDRDKEFGALQEKIYRVGGAIQKEESTVDFSLKELERLERAEGRFHEGLKAIESKLDHSANESLRLGREVEEWSNKLEAEKKKLAELEIKNKELTDLKGLLTSENDKVKAALVEVLTQMASMRNDSANLTKRLEILEYSIKKNMKDQSEATSRLEVIREDSLNLEKRLDERRVRIADLHEEIQKGSQRHGDLIKAAEELKEICDEEKAELHRSSSRLSSLLELNESYEGFHKGVRDIMMAYRSGRLGQGVLMRLVAEVIDVPAKFEGLVEGALGDKLQGVIVENHPEGIGAIKYLKENASGRATFIPRVPRVPQEKTDNKVKENKGVTGPLSRWIRVKEGYEGVGEYLFGDLWVVEDIEEGLKLWEEKGPEVKIVTMEGDTIDPAGVLNGGGKTSEGVGLLRRKRESEELNQAIVKMNAEIERKELKRKGFLEAAAKEEAILDTLREEMRQGELEILDMEKKLEWMAEEIQRLEKRMDLLLMEKEELDRDYRKADGEFEKVSEDLLELEWNKREKEIKANRIQRDLSSLDTEMKQVGSMITESRVHIASMEEKVEHLEGNRHQIDSTMKDLEKEIVRQREEIEEGRQEYKVTKNAIDEARVRIVMLMREYQDLQEESGRIKGDFQSLSEKIRELEDQRQDHRGQKGEIEKRIQENRLKEREILSALGYVSEELKENFGIVAEESSLPSKDAYIDEGQLRGQLETLRASLDRLGEVNLMAIEEFRDLNERHRDLKEQREDLVNAIRTLQKTIVRINRTSRQRFREAFQAIDQQFMKVFPLLFGGGEARLTLTEDGDVLESGVEIFAQPPGKKLQNIQLLSGGEKAMTAVALIFSTLMIKPTPFCLLDEVDAPLDDANIDRFNNLLKGMSKDRQFILVTHNKRTMEVANTLYGITMETPGVTKLISVKLN